MSELTEIAEIVVKTGVASELLFVDETLRTFSSADGETTLTGWNLDFQRKCNWQDTRNVFVSSWSAQIS